MIDLKSLKVEISGSTATIAQRALNVIIETMDWPAAFDDEHRRAATELATAFAAACAMSTAKAKEK